jgi:hypothetical protein
LFHVPGISVEDNGILCARDEPARIRLVETERCDAVLQPTNLGPTSPPIAVQRRDESSARWTSDDAACSFIRRVDFLRLAGLCRQRCGGSSFFSQGACPQAKQDAPFVVRSQPCLICKQVPSHPHHLKFAQARTLGRKVSNEFTVPLCRTHHQNLHRHGNEKAWWANMQIEPMSIAKQLWDASQSGDQEGTPILPNPSHTSTPEGLAT